MERKMDLNSIGYLDWMAFQTKKQMLLNNPPVFSLIVRYTANAYHFKQL